MGDGHWRVEEAAVRCVYVCVVCVFVVLDGHWRVEEAAVRCVYVWFVCVCCVRWPWACGGGSCEVCICVICVCVGVYLLF